MSYSAVLFFCRVSAIIILKFKCQGSWYVCMLVNGVNVPLHAALFITLHVNINPNCVHAYSISPHS